MKLAVMQPYFVPYIGYFQLIGAVDTYVIDDRVQYIKQGWVNRNRYLCEGRDIMFTIPLKKESTYLNINERYIADNFNREKLLNQIESAYRKAPYFRETFELWTQIINYQEIKLADYIYHSIIAICTHIGIRTNIVRTVSIDYAPSLNSVGRIDAFCRIFDSKTYVNAIGGVELYSKERFADKGIDLKFIQSKPIAYKQFDHEFVPWLSIIDVLMFNPIEKVRLMLNEYELI